MDRETAFHSIDYVSQFARSGVLAMVDLTTKGLLEADGLSTTGCRRRHDGLSDRAAAATHRHGAPMNRASTSVPVPGVKVPAGYQGHFARSLARTARFWWRARRSDVVHEYNVLRRLSAARRPLSPNSSPAMLRRVTRSLRCAASLRYQTFSVIPGLAHLEPRISRRRSASTTSSMPRIFTAPSSRLTLSITPMRPI